MPEINFNGEISQPDTLLFSASNRAFRYGDGIFESIRMFEGRIPFLSLHLERLFFGADLLSINLNEEINGEFITKEIQRITSNYPNARIRLQLFRNNGGLYKPATNESSYLIEINALTKSSFEYPANGIHIGICPYPLASNHYLSAIKSCNRLPSIAAAIYAQEKQLDDCLILNNDGFIAESSSSNIFFIKGKKLFTPPLSAGCINGVMRVFVSELAIESGFQILEKPIHPRDISSFEEVFLTNAIQGIKPVRQIQDINFDIVKSNVLLSVLNEFIHQ